MESPQNIIIGIEGDALPSTELSKMNDEELIKHYSIKRKYPFFRLFLALAQYLQHTNKFDRIFLNITLHYPIDLKGIIKQLHHSEVDIHATPQFMEEMTDNIFNYSYPFKMLDFTFFTSKPEYKPHFFGIFQTFSLNVWMTLASVLFFITLLSYFVLKNKCSFCKIVLHVFAVLMKQNAVIIPSSFGEKLLIYSWVIGAMILCLSHDSVFLSFLSFPPFMKIEHLSDLAVAVQKGDYNCIALGARAMVKYLQNIEHLRVIAEDIDMNDKDNIRFQHLQYILLSGSKTTEVAYFVPTDILELFVGKFFISEDRFFQTMNAMRFRRDFCCKELLDTFVHRMMASGIYFKYLSDHISRKSPFIGIGEVETRNRKLTLTDLAPAFMFLVSGYFISFLVFFWEILSNGKNVRNLKITKKRRRRNACSMSSI